MKVYNLGNDYAYQKKQKQVKNQSAEKPIKPEVTTEANAGDQVQNGGEGKVVASITETSTPKQKPKKKKETGAENEQPED